MNADESTPDGPESAPKGKPRRTPRKRLSGGETPLQQAITKALKAYGYETQHVYRMRTESGAWRTSTTASGWPDLVCIRGPWLLAIEVKGHRGVVDDEQVLWLARFAAVPGCRAWVLRPGDDRAEWQRWMRHPETAPRRYGWSVEQAAVALAAHEVKTARRRPAKPPPTDGPQRLPL